MGAAAPTEDSPALATTAAARSGLGGSAGADRDPRGDRACAGEGHEAVSIFVSQLQAHRHQTVPQRQRRHLAEDRVL